MPVNKTGVKKNGLQQYRVRVNYTDAAGKARQIERTAYGLAEANALEQFRAYISEAKKNARTVTDWAFYVFFCIAFYTGARKGEINALKWSDIDGNVLHIRRSISQKLKGGDIEGPPKNKSSYRELPAGERNLVQGHVAVLYLAHVMQY